MRFGIWCTALSALLITSINGYAQAPLNDNLANAQVISGESGSTTGSNVGASTEALEPSGQASVWYQWTAPFTGRIEFTTAGSNFDTILDFFRGPSFKGIVSLDSDDDGNGDSTSRVQVDVVQNTVYHIRVHGFGGETGSIALAWSKVPAPGTFSISAPSSRLEAPNATITVTVRRTGGSDGTVTVDYRTVEEDATEGADFVAASGSLQFLTGELQKTFTVSLVNDNTPETPEFLGLEIRNASAGAQIGDRFAYVLINDDDHPANDSLATPTAITGASGSITSSLVNATPQPGEPTNASGNTVWFLWTAPNTGAAILNASSDDFAPLLTVHTGDSFANLIKVASNAAVNLGDVSASRLVFPVTAGTTYRIQAESRFGTDRDLELDWAIAVNGAIEFSQPRVSVSEAGNTFASFTATRIGSTVGDVTAEYELTPGTAAEGSDYTGAAAGTLTFTGGASSKVIEIAIGNDQEAEGDETASLILTDITGGDAVLGNRLSSRLDIVDDDDDPANDLFVNAQILPGSFDVIPTRNLGADIDPGEPTVSEAIDSDDSGVVWYRWTAPADGVVRFGTSRLYDPEQEEFFSTLLRVYTGSNLTNLNLKATATSFESLDSDDFGSIDSDDFITLPVTAGETLKLAASGTEGREGLFDLGWRFTQGGTISLSADDVSETASFASVTVTRQGGDQSPVSLRIFTVGETATAGVDYGTLNTILFFAPGETSKTVTFPVVNDSAREGDEFLRVRFQILTGDVLGGTNHIFLSITDDDDDPVNDAFANAAIITGATGTVEGTSIGSSTEASEPGNGAGSVWYRWTAPSTGVVTFTAAHEDFSAGLAVYTGTSLGTLSSIASAAGTDTTAVSFGATAGVSYYVAVLDEFWEGADFALSWEMRLNQSSIQFQSSALKVSEETPSIVAVVTRTGNLSAGATVAFTTDNGTATAGTDYTAATGTLEFAAGQTTASITVPIINDTLVEGEEAFLIALSNPTGEAILNGSGTIEVTINDDDDDPANDDFADATILPGVSGTLQSLNVGASLETGETPLGGEDSHSIWFAWTAPATGVVTFHTEGSSFDTVLAAYSGTSLAGLTQLAIDDDSGTGSTSLISFMATAGTTYRITADGYDGEEGIVRLTWRLRLAGTLEFSSPTFTQSESGPAATITVRRIGGADGEVTVQYKAADGTASAGLDYSATAGRLTFADGEVTKTFTVPVINDPVFESTETVLLELSNATGGASLGAVSAVLSIENDSDLFFALDGSYTGLLAPSTFDPSKAGSISLNSTASGSFTGSLLLGGKKVGFRGVFNENGSTGPITINRKGGTPLTLTLQITDGSDEITGTLVDGTSTVAISANLDTFDAKENPTPRAGKYTMLLPGEGNEEGTPRGTGYATLSITTAGQVRVVGSLADGTAFTTGTTLSKSGEIPLYVPLYAKKGVIAGELQFRSQPGISDADGVLNWMRPSATKGNFSQGFTLEQPAVVSEWAFSGGRALEALDLTGGIAKFEAGLGGLGESVTHIVRVGANNRVAITRSASAVLKLEIDSTTGLFSGSLKSPTDAKPTKFSGAFLQDQNLGGGYFIRGSESGFVEITPAE